MAKVSVINEVPAEVLRNAFLVHEDGVSLTLRIKPNAAKEKLFLNENNEITLSVSAAALENAANLRVCQLLAEILSIPKSQIEIINGHRSRVKRIFIYDFVHTVDK